MSKYRAVAVADGYDSLTAPPPGEFDGQLLQSAFKGKALPGWEPIHGPNQNSYGVDPTTGRPL